MRNPVALFGILAALLLGSHGAHAVDRCDIGGPGAQFSAAEHRLKLRRQAAGLENEVVEIKLLRSSGKIETHRARGVSVGDDGIVRVEGTGMQGDRVLSISKAPLGHGRLGLIDEAHILSQAEFNQGVRTNQGKPVVVSTADGRVLRGSIVDMGGGKFSVFPESAPGNAIISQPFNPSEVTSIDAPAAAARKLIEKAHANGDSVLISTSNRQVSGKIISIDGKVITLDILGGQGHIGKRIVTERVNIDDVVDAARPGERPAHARDEPRAKAPGPDPAYARDNAPPPRDAPPPRQSAGPAHVEKLLRQAKGLENEVVEITVQRSDGRVETYRGDGATVIPTEGGRVLTRLPKGDEAFLNSRVLNIRKAPAGYGAKGLVNDITPMNASEISQAARTNSGKNVVVATRDGRILRGSFGQMPDGTYLVTPEQFKSGHAINIAYLNPEDIALVETPNQYARRSVSRAVANEDVVTLFVGDHQVTGKVIGVRDGQATVQISGYNDMSRRMNSISVNLDELTHVAPASNFEQAKAQSADAARAAEDARAARDAAARETAARDAAARDAEAARAARARDDAARAARAQADAVRAAREAEAARAPKAPAVGMDGKQTWENFNRDPRLAKDYVLKGKWARKTLSRIGPDGSEIPLPPGASASEIKAAYRELSQRYHPDKYDGAIRAAKTDAERAKLVADKASAEEALRAVNTAYDYLKQK